MSNCGCGHSGNNSSHGHNSGCGNGPCGGGTPCDNGPCHSVQPEKVRMSRNVNANCTPCCPQTSCASSCSQGAKSCTRKEWLMGIDCSQWSFNLNQAELGVEQGAIAKLRAVFKNGAGYYSDATDARITIRGPCGKIFLSNQVMSRETPPNAPRQKPTCPVMPPASGKYYFLFGTNGNTDIGIWTAEVSGLIDGIRVSSSYCFAVLPHGSIPFNCCGDGYGDGYGCDGYGDGYGHDGYGCGDPCKQGILSGADGYGTFAGREECGFDGCKSKDIPATGGCRTNRNEIGNGFWDGISNKESCVTPIGKRGQCMKDKCVAMTRVRLKDIVPSCWAFGEDEIDMLLETSLSDFNAWPTFTCFTWDTLPDNFLGVIVLGAQIFGLFAQGMLEAGREFNVTDNGISFTPPQISGYMQTSASALLAHYTELREKIKANIKPSPGGIGTFRVMSVVPQLSRLRHLRSKQII